MSRERLFEPFAGWLIRPEWAARVIAGAYDTKSPAERREIVSTNPYSYLGVTRSAEDLAPGDDCLLYTSPSPRDKRQSRMPSSA